MTKEQMIEKIRKTVIVANNPKCKSYDEAIKSPIILPDNDIMS